MPGIGVAQEQVGTIRIEAAPDLCWTATIDLTTEAGCGSKVFEVEDAIIVANAQKDTELGALTLVLEIDGVEIDRKTTTAPYGFVQVSE